MSSSSRPRGRRLVSPLSDTNDTESLIQPLGIASKSSTSSRHSFPPTEKSLPITKLRAALDEVPSFENRQLKSTQYSQQKGSTEPRSPQFDPPKEHMHRQYYNGDPYHPRFSPRSSICLPETALASKTGDANTSKQALVSELALITRLQLL